MNWKEYSQALATISYGKKLPSAVYIFRPNSSFSVELTETIQRAENAAKPDLSWNLLKLHTNQFAITFLSYPSFDEDPHPALTRSTKINLESGSIVQSDYSARPNPPILHRKETFLPPDDSRIEIFRRLTAQEEAAGLYEETTRIGLRIQWQALLKAKRLAYNGHELIRLDSSAPLEHEGPVIERHRTAIKRYDLSKPLKLMIESGLLSQKNSFFDFGCGHGMDIEALQNLGYQARGWDPAFRPNEPKVKSDVVNLGYVLNVIENPDERVQTLKEAFGLSNRLMVVSTLAAGKETEAHARPYSDGYLTKSNTFQKFFGPGELENLIEQTLEVEVATLTLGICVVFRNAEDAENFAASRTRRHVNWAEINGALKFSSPPKSSKTSVGRYELHKDLYEEFWTTLLDLGRLPEPGEYDRISDVREASGGLNKALGLLLKQKGSDLWNLVQKSRAEDVLVYLAMTNFRKRFLIRDIPLRIKNDIKWFFGDVNTAKAKARDLLYAAGDPGEVQLAIEGLDFGVFSQQEMQFTFHQCLLPKLPALLRIYVYCAAVRYGNPEEADLIKIHARSGKLTFLHYLNFDSDEHPILLTRIKVNLRTQYVEVFDHSADRQRLENKMLYKRTTSML